MKFRTKMMNESHQSGQMIQPKRAYLINAYISFNNQMLSKCKKELITNEVTISQLDTCNTYKIQVIAWDKLDKDRIIKKLLIKDYGVKSLQIDNYNDCIKQEIDDKSFKVIVDNNEVKITTNLLSKTFDISRALQALGIYVQNDENQKLIKTILENCYKYNLPYPSIINNNCCKWFFDDEHEIVLRYEGLYVNLYYRNTEKYVDRDAFFDELKRLYTDLNRDILDEKIVYKDGLATLLISHDGYMALDDYMLYGGFHTGPGQSRYKFHNLESTINCRKKFAPIKNKYMNTPKLFLELNKYSYKVLYKYYNNIGHLDRDYEFILSIRDADNNLFYLYVSYRFKNDCSTCSGGLEYIKEQMTYSDNLQDLLDFVYTKTQQLRILDNIKN